MYTTLSSLDEGQYKQAKKNVFVSHLLPFHFTWNTESHILHMQPIFIAYFPLNRRKTCPADNIPVLCVIMMTNDNKTMFVLLCSLFPLGANQKEMC